MYYEVKFYTNAIITLAIYHTFILSTRIGIAAYLAIYTSSVIRLMVTVV